MRLKNEIKEILKFIVGGTSAVLTDYLSYCMLVHWGNPAYTAKLISFVLGSIVGFIINKHWTFESNRFSTGEFVRYAALYLITACLNVAINNMVLDVTGIYLLAFLCATAVSTILNFLGQKFFVFRDKGE